MKKLKVEKFDLQMGKNKNVDTCSLLEYCMDIVPQGGYTPAMLRKYLRVQKTIEKAREEDKKNPDKVVFIHFEDEDVGTVKDIVRNSRWGSRSPEVLRFVELVEGL